MVKRMSDETNASQTNRIAAVEAALLASCEKARARGVGLVSGAFSAENGVCAWGANCMDPDAICHDLSCDEYDAVEDGWDSWMASGRMRTSKPLAWFALGRRLACEFSPVPAITENGT